MGFSPSLYVGATLGAGFAGLLALLPLPMPIDIRSVALVCMGAMVAAAPARCAVAMIFEMTRDYDIVAPMIIAVAFSVGMRRSCRVRTSTR